MGRLLACRDPKDGSHLLRMDAVKRLVRRRLEPKIAERATLVGDLDPENRAFHRVCAYAISIAGLRRGRRSYFRSQT